eukprot:TRINITY_DN21285_c0_g1_i1.p1 TRINITY_DN21285_c0_g1~~TRINITY_DN21285_c0_g1_i1.p1  ORF type:complete len:367 (-),score=46.53 TRINITY_DN21285_c0_g1_i1:90-1115(-)
MTFNAHGRVLHGTGVSEVLHRAVQRVTPFAYKTHSTFSLAWVLDEQRDALAAARLQFVKAAAPRGPLAGRSREVRDELRRERWCPRAKAWVDAREEGRSSQFFCSEWDDVHRVIRAKAAVESILDAAEHTPENVRQDLVRFLAARGRSDWAPEPPRPDTGSNSTWNYKRMWVRRTWANGFTHEQAFTDWVSIVCRGAGAASVSNILLQLWPSFSTDAWDPTSDALALCRMHHLSQPHTTVELEWTRLFYRHRLFDKPLGMPWGDKFVDTRTNNPVKEFNADPLLGASLKFQERVRALRALLWGTAAELDVDVPWLLQRMAADNALREKHSIMCPLPLRPNG